MKICNKILPLTAVVAIGAIPVVATSCSNVYFDMASKRYVPSFARAEASEVTSKEATNIYTDYFKSHAGNMIPDFYWGASFYARVGIHEREEPTQVITFLSHYYDAKIKPTDRGPILSYKLKTQAEFKHTTPGGSYSVCTYDIYWEINNLEFWAINYNRLKDTDGEYYECWSLCPFKFDNERGVWWQELKGNEQVKFNFKTVKKGYSESGAQNYVWEGSEAAIVDEKHKYVPELAELYTSIMLVDSWYLSSLTQKMTVVSTTHQAEKSGDTYDGVLTYKFGPNTKNEYAGQNITFSVYGNPIIYSIQGSTLEVENSGITFTGDTTIKQDSDMKITAHIKPKTGTQAKTGDIVYYTVKASCPAVDEQHPAWDEYFYISGVIV